MTSDLPGSGGHAPDLPASLDMLARAFTRMPLAFRKVIDRVSSDQGRAWLAEALRAAPFSTFPGTPQSVVGPVPLAVLKQLKTTGRNMTRSSLDEEERLRGSLAYLLATAGALVHHDVLISSLANRGLQLAMLDLAAAMPEPWESFMSDAALKLHERASARVDNPLGD